MQDLQQYIWTDNRGKQGRCGFGARGIADPNPYDTFIDNALAFAHASNSITAGSGPLRTGGKKRSGRGRGSREGDDQASE